MLWVTSLCSLFLSLRSFNHHVTKLLLTLRQRLHRGRNSKGILGGISSSSSSSMSQPIKAQIETGSDPGDLWTLTLDDEQWSTGLLPPLQSFFHLHCLVHSLHPPSSRKTHFNIYIDVWSVYSLRNIFQRSDGVLSPSFYPSDSLLQPSAANQMLCFFAFLKGKLFVFWAAKATATSQLRQHNCDFHRAACS